MSRLIWSPAALLDVKRLYDFLKSKNLGAAKRAVKAIRQVVKVLEKQSGVGRPVEDMEDEFRDWIIDFGDSGYVVRYRVGQRFITVLSVRHQKRWGISEFLKELELTEGRSTGVPKILKAMAANDSPAPLFKTDDDRLACVVRLPVHPMAKRPDGKVTDQVTDQVTAEIARLLAAAAQGEHTRNALQEALGLKHTPHFRQAFLLPALEAGLIEMTLPDKPRSSKQRYRLTPQGQRWLDTHPDGAR